MATPPGLEPGTERLVHACSSIELRGHYEAVRRIHGPSDRLNCLSRCPPPRHVWSRKVRKDRCLPWPRRPGGARPTSRQHRTFRRFAPAGLHETRNAASSFSLANRLSSPSREPYGSKSQRRDVHIRGVIFAPNQVNVGLRGGTVGSDDRRPGDDDLSPSSMLPGTTMT
jgi:hypothetical protein